jgi:hypothetical protein
MGFSFSQSRAVAAVYESLGMLTTDQIAATQAHRDEFVDRYRTVTGDTEHSADEVIDRLINMRKTKGQLVTKHQGHRNN